MQHTHDDAADLARASLAHVIKNLSIGSFVVLSKNEGPQEATTKSGGRCEERPTFQIAKIVSNVKYLKSSTAPRSWRYSSPSLQSSSSSSSSSTSDFEDAHVNERAVRMIPDADVRNQYADDHGPLARSSRPREGSNRRHKIISEERSCTRINNPAGRLSSYGSDVKHERRQADGRAYSLSLRGDELTSVGDSAPSDCNSSSNGEGGHVPHRLTHGNRKRAKRNSQRKEGKPLRGRRRGASTSSLDCEGKGEGRKGKDRGRSRSSTSSSLLPCVDVIFYDVYGVSSDMLRAYTLMQETAAHLRAGAPAVFPSPITASQSGVGVASSSRGPSTGVVAGTATPLLTSSSNLRGLLQAPSGLGSTFLSAAASPAPPSFATPRGGGGGRRRASMLMVAPFMSPALSPPSGALVPQASKALPLSADPLATGASSAAAGFLGADSASLLYATRINPNNGTPTNQHPPLPSLPSERDRDGNLYCFTARTPNSSLVEQMAFEVSVCDFLAQYERVAKRRRSKEEAKSGVGANGSAHSRPNHESPQKGRVWAPSSAAGPPPPSPPLNSSTTSHSKSMGTDDPNRPASLALDLANFRFGDAEDDGGPFGGVGASTSSVGTTSATSGGVDLFHFLQRRASGKSHRHHKRLGAAASGTHESLLPSPTSRAGGYTSSSSSPRKGHSPAGDGGGGAFPHRGSPRKRFASFASSEVTPAYGLHSTTSFALTNHQSNPAVRADDRGAEHAQKASSEPSPTTMALIPHRVEPVPTFIASAVRIGESPARRQLFTGQFVTVDAIGHFLAPPLRSPSFHMPTKSSPSPAAGSTLMRGPQAVSASLITPTSTNSATSGGIFAGIPRHRSASLSIATTSGASATPTTVLPHTSNTNSSQLPFITYPLSTSVTGGAPSTSLNGLASLAAAGAGGVNNARLTSGSSWRKRLYSTGQTTTATSTSAGFAEGGEDADPVDKPAPQEPYHFPSDEKRLSFPPLNPNAPVLAHEYFILLPSERTATIEDRGIDTNSTRGTSTASKSNESREGSEENETNLSAWSLASSAPHAHGRGGTASSVSASFYAHLSASSGNLNTNSKSAAAGAAGLTVGGVDVSTTVFTSVPPSSSAPAPTNPHGGMTSRQLQLAKATATAALLRHVNSNASLMRKSPLDEEEEEAAVERFRSSKGRTKNRTRGKRGSERSRFRSSVFVSRPSSASPFTAPFGSSREAWLGLAREIYFSSHATDVALVRAYHCDPVTAAMVLRQAGGEPPLGSTAPNHAINKETANIDEVEPQRSRKGSRRRASGAVQKNPSAKWLTPRGADLATPLNMLSATVAGSSAATRSSTASDGVTVSGSPPKLFVTSPAPESPSHTSLFVAIDSVGQALEGELPRFPNDSKSFATTCTAPPSLPTPNRSVSSNMNLFQSLARGEGGGGVVKSAGGPHATIVNANTSRVPSVAHSLVVASSSPSPSPHRQRGLPQLDPDSTFVPSPIVRTVRVADILLTNVPLTEHCMTFRGDQFRETDRQTALAAAAASNAYGGGGLMSIDKSYQGGGALTAHTDHHRSGGGGGGRGNNNNSSAVGKGASLPPGLVASPSPAGRSFSRRLTVWLGNGGGGGRGSTTTEAAGPLVTLQQQQNPSSPSKATSSHHLVSANISGGAQDGGGGKQTNTVSGGAVGVSSGGVAALPSSAGRVFKSRVQLAAFLDARLVHTFWAAFHTRLVAEKSVPGERRVAGKAVSEQKDGLMTCGVEEPASVPLFMMPSSRSSSDHDDDNDRTLKTSSPLVEVSKPPPLGNDSEVRQNIPDNSEPNVPPPIVTSPVNLTPTPPTPKFVLSDGNEEVKQNRKALSPPTISTCILDSSMKAAESSTPEGDSTISPTATTARTTRAAGKGDETAWPFAEASMSFSTKRRGQGAVTLIAENFLMTPKEKDRERRLTCTSTVGSNTPTAASTPRSRPPSRQQREKLEPDNGSAGGSSLPIASPKDAQTYTNGDVRWTVFAFPRGEKSTERGGNFHPFSSFRLKAKVVLQRVTLESVLQLKSAIENNSILDEAVSELEVHFMAFDSSDYLLEELASVVAVRLPNLKLFSLVHDDASDVLPYAMTKLLHRPHHIPTSADTTEHGETEGSQQLTVINVLTSSVVGGVDGPSATAIVPTGCTVGPKRAPIASCGHLTDGSRLLVVTKTSNKASTTTAPTSEKSSPRPRQLSLPFVGCNIPTGAGEGPLSGKKNAQDGSSCAKTLFSDDMNVTKSPRKEEKRSAFHVTIAGEVPFYVSPLSRKEKPPQLGGAVEKRITATTAGAVERPKAAKDGPAAPLACLLSESGISDGEKGNDTLLMSAEEVSERFIEILRISIGQKGSRADDMAADSGSHSHHSKGGCSQKGLSGCAAYNRHTAFTSLAQVKSPPSAPSPVTVRGGMSVSQAYGSMRGSPASPNGRNTTAQLLMSRSATMAAASRSRREPLRSYLAIPPPSSALVKSGGHDTNSPLAVLPAVGGGLSSPILQLGSASMSNVPTSLASAAFGSSPLPTASFSPLFPYLPSPPQYVHQQASSARDATAASNNSVSRHFMLKEAHQADVAAVEEGASDAGIVEGRVSVSVGVQSLVNAVYFRLMCRRELCGQYAASRTATEGATEEKRREVDASAKEKRMFFLPLESLAFVNCGLEDTNVSDLATILPLSSRVSLSKNRLGKGFVSVFSNAAEELLQVPLRLEPKNTTSSERTNAQHCDSFRIGDCQIESRGLASIVESLPLTLAVRLASATTSTSTEILRERKGADMNVSTWGFARLRELNLSGNSLSDDALPPILDLLDCQRLVGRRGLLCLAAASSGKRKDIEGALYDGGALSLRQIDLSFNRLSHAMRRDLSERLGNAFEQPPTSHLRCSLPLAMWTPQLQRHQPRAVDFFVTQQAITFLLCLRANEAEAEAVQQRHGHHGTGGAVQVRRPSLLTTMCVIAPNVHYSKALLSRTLFGIGDGDGDMYPTFTSSASTQRASERRQRALATLRSAREDASPQRSMTAYDRDTSVAMYILTFLPSKAARARVIV